LKGVGEYTAAGLPVFLMKWFPLWTECVLVLSRYFDVETDIASGQKRSLHFELTKDNPALLTRRLWSSCFANQSPNCGVCVFNDSCAAKKKVDQLPVKSKLKVRNRYFNYLVVSDENENTLIQKRTAKGIWQNLYEFPLIETAKEEEFDFV
jgi:A/G-specific adenine glycosylase